MQQTVFIAGFPSGGTDLTKTILNAHPDIYINGEMPFLYQLEQLGFSADDLMTPSEVEQLRIFLKERNINGSIENVDVPFLGEVSIPLQDALYNLFSTQERNVWGNKTPQNTQRISELSRIFPKAKFIIVVRDVRDVCLSWYDKWGKDMKWCAAKWSERMKQAWTFNQQLSPQQCIFVNFESLLDDSESICRQLCSFLEIPFSACMLEHHKYTKHKVDGKRNYGQPILSTNKQKWRTRLSSAQIKRIEEIAYETMILFGYKPVYTTETRPITKVEYRLGQLRDISSLFLVGNRARTNNGLTKKIQTLSKKIKKERLHQKQQADITLPSLD